VHLAVRDLRVEEKVFDGGNDGGDAGFVIGTEECGAVGAYEVTVDDRPDVMSRAVGGGIEVGDESDDGERIVGVGRKCGVEVTVLVEPYVMKSDAGEFLCKVLGEEELSGSGGAGRGGGVGLGIEGDVMQEALKRSHGVWVGRLVEMNGLV
jgi:hypothetical protein